MALDEARHAVVSTKGTFAAPFCLAQAAAQQGKACLDVEREQVKAGAKPSACSRPTSLRWRSSDLP